MLGIGKERQSGLNRENDHVWKKISLFRLFGFEVHADLSWLFLALLVTWSLAVGYFPYGYRNLATSTYWFMGAAGALGLFLSIVFHEMWHSLVARRFGLPMKGITLFIFGGVAEMNEEPQSARAEFFMAIAGPVSSVAIGIVFYWAGILAENGGSPVPVVAVLSYLAYINWVLAGFNLIPAFPLDGGRVLRSALWHFKKDIRWATKIASQAGSGFGFVLMFLGVLSLLGGNVIGGIWWFVIGMFLRSIAAVSYQQVMLRHALQGEKVRTFMKRDPVTAPPTITVQDLVDDYMYKHNYKMLPVADDGNLRVA